MASNTPATSRITASDISRAALDVARENAATHLAGRITLCKATYLRRSMAHSTLCWPTSRTSLQRNWANDPNSPTNPRLPSSVAMMVSISFAVSSVNSPRHLAIGGAVALEFDPSQAVIVTGLLLQTHVFSPVQVHRDYAGLPRFATAIRV